MEDLAACTVFSDQRKGWALYIVRTYPKGLYESTHERSLAGSQRSDQAHFRIVLEAAGKFRGKTASIPFRARNEC